MFAVLVDGETEKWYLDKLRAYERPEGVTIKPDLPGKTSLREQFEAVKRNADIYDASIWIVDLDVIIRDHKEQLFHEFLREIQSTIVLRDRIFVLVNAPSLEFWFLLHVKDTGKFYPDCESVINELRKFHPLKEYAKSEKYFITGHPDIYTRLRPYLPVARRFAERQGNYNPENPKRGIAELYKLFDILEIPMVAK